MVKYYFEKSRRGDFDIDPVRECDNLVSFHNLSEDDAEIIRKSYEEDPTHSSKEIKNILQNSGKNVQMQPD